MYFEFDPNFTSEVIQKNIRLQFDRRETGNKIKFLHILKPGGIAVSYTHLDVYKRQGVVRAGGLHFKTD